MAMGDAAMDPKQLAQAMTDSMYRAIDETNARKHLGKWPVDPGQETKEPPKEEKPVSTKHGWHATRWMTADEIEAMPEVTVSQRIAKARKKAGMKQMDVIERTGLTVLSQWETGMRKPSPENVAKLAKCIGVTSEWLKGDDYPDVPAIREEKTKPEANKAPDTKPKPTWTCHDCGKIFSAEHTADKFIREQNGSEFELCVDCAVKFDRPKPKPAFPSYEDLLPKEPVGILDRLGIELPNFPTYEELLDKLVMHLSKNRSVSYACPCCGAKLELAVALQEVKV